MDRSCKPLIARRRSADCCQYARRIAAVLVAAACAVSLAHAANVDWWLTTVDPGFQLAPQPGVEAVKARNAKADVEIVVDPETSYQSILGLGSSLEHATAQNLALLPQEESDAVIDRLFDPVHGIGMNIMRICIGTSDFTGTPWYSYCDMPPGETDPELKNFSIDKDRDTVLPLIKRVREKYPDVVFIAAPWSGPGWMKDNDSLLAGSVKPEYYDAFARYLARFVEAYEAEGIPIYSITPQNEPDFPNPDYPTTKWTPEQQRDFIRDHLGPLFAEKGFDTEIWCWDHNFNYVKFPRTILSDPEAAKYTAGTAFHFYEGKPESMGELAEEFPDKPVYFTEGSAFGVRGARRIMEILHNHARSYNAWVTVLNEERGPNNGPHSASETIITLHRDDMELTYNFDYYMYGHFMKFIPRGAVRVGSSGFEDKVSNIAFRNPDGSLTVVVSNENKDERAVAIVVEGEAVKVEMPSLSLATFVWPEG